MARKKRVKKHEPEVIKEEEKLDYVFRIFQKTNNLGNKCIVRIELPNNEVHKKHYGNMPKFETVIPYIGQEFELYLDGEFIEKRVLLEADKEKIVHDVIEGGNDG